MLSQSRTTTRTRNAARSPGMRNSVPIARRVTRRQVSRTARGSVRPVHDNAVGTYRTTTRPNAIRYHAKKREVVSCDITHEATVCREKR